jgi:hypothetical protein
MSGVGILLAVLLVALCCGGHLLALRSGRSSKKGSNDG